MIIEFYRDIDSLSGKIANRKLKEISEVINSIDTIIKADL